VLVAIQKFYFALGIFFNFAVCTRAERLAFQPQFGCGGKMRSAVKPLKLFAFFSFSVFLLPSLSFAQYVRTDLVSNTGTAQNPADLDLVNGWGLVSTATSPFWVSDNGTGKSTLYAISNPPQGPTATKQGLVVTIPSATAGAQGTPTGIVANESASTNSDFTVTDPVSHKSGRAIFIFATLDGTIAVGTRGCK
jgi:hypothetical protein